MKKVRFMGMMLVVLMMAGIFMVSSCSNQKAGEKGAAVEKTDGKKTIGVSLLKENDDFYISLKKGLQEAAAELGYNIEILSADNDEMKQDKNVDTLLLKKIDALIICPVNSKGVGYIIKKATDKGIPVFTADIDAEQGDVVAHVASDNYMGGKLAAERMIQLLGPGAKVGVVQIPGVESVAARTKGFSDAAKAAGLEILLPYLNGKDDTQESERVANTILAREKDTKGFFAANDNMAMGVESAINASGLDIVLIGYDAAPAAQSKIKEGGVWKADVIQYPGKIGQKTVETIDKYLKGELEATSGTIKVPVEVGLVDAENL